MHLHHSPHAEASSYAEEAGHSGAVHWCVCVQGEGGRVRMSEDEWVRWMEYRCISINT